MEENYLQSAFKQFEYYQLLGENTFKQLTDEELFWKYSDANNSIAIIVNHLCGNMKSRWTNFLTSDGEKEWRNRDEEFEDNIQTKEELLRKWEEGWSCLFTALNTINKDNFDTPISIRNQSHSILEAINRQLCHYAYHVGQIVFIGSLIKQHNWESLSIPKGGSKKFNANKFAQGKHGGHFTDDIK